MGHAVPSEAKQFPGRGAEEQNMTQKQDNAKSCTGKRFSAGDRTRLRTLVQEALQEVLEADMDEVLGAQKSERTAERVGYRSGYYRPFSCPVVAATLGHPQKSWPDLGLSLQALSAVSAQTPSALVQSMN
jgi:hypothetical protein